jgi:hypothetical protein
MAYKERVPVCGAILISEFWDKVNPRRIIASASSLIRPYAGPTCQGLAEGSLVVVSSREDQQGGARRDVCYSRGTFGSLEHSVLS